MPPKVLAKSDRPGGILPVSAAARNAPAKQPVARLKLEIRRLPPSLTLTEFEETLGEEWKLGKGKIDWREYRQGKVKSPGKLPEQSRCYVHVTGEALLKDFEQRFLAVVFHDKAGTYKNSELKHLPPTLGFAPNQRVPVQGKQRADNRQGTIDQDAEFIAFLEAETQPIPRAAAIDAANVEKDDSRIEVKSTPLIDDLREKKANKAKAAASKAEKKSHARAESKEAVGSKGQGKRDVKKIEQAAKDAAKVLNKQVAGKQLQKSSQPASETPPPQQAKNASPARKKQQQQQQQQQQQRGQQQLPKAVDATPAPSSSAPANPAPPRAPAPRQRGNADGIKKMLQKDLGIRPKDGTNPGSGRSRGNTQPAASASASRNTSTPQSVPAPPSETKSTTSGPAATSSAAATSSSSSSSSSNPIPATTATSPKAFLKHANPSQGITEILIMQALSQYGDVVSVTIDPRKGTAIAVFKSAVGLKKAIETKKVSVADGAIEILEYKDRGGGGGGGGGGTASRGGIRGNRGGNRGRSGAQAPSTMQSAATASTNPKS